MTFARTKIQPPRARSAFVERGTLQAQLADALATRRLVLLCAPAGYGKTMLLAREIAHLPPSYAVAWISADVGDDLQRLLECMLAALEPFDPPWRTAPEALLTRLGRGSADDERAVAVEIINTLDACEVPHGVIVLDDAHRVDDPAFFRFLGRIIERVSARWTIALTSRTEPPIALARLRAADELAEFRQLHLQFARDEARQLGAAGGLDQATVDRIFDRTQGWPAGMRIAIGALRADDARPAPLSHGDGRSALERALRAGERPIFEFLTTEVLEQLRPELSDFLSRVSVLPELEASRCATVSGNPDAVRLLDQIERLGLFVDALDGPVRTLRLHDLFRDAMQQRLAFEHPALLAELRARAAATEPDPVRRITMLVGAGQYDEAADLVFAHVPSIVATAGPATAQHLIGQFPAGFRERSPDLAFVVGVAGWLEWKFASMIDCFERAERGYAAAGNEERLLLARAYRATVLLALVRLDEATALLDSIERATFPDTTRAVVLNAKSWLALEIGNLYSVAPLRSELVDVLERVDRMDLWWHTTPPTRMPGLPGMTRPMMRHSKALLRVAGDQPMALRALGLLTQAWCAMFQGHFAEARALIERAIAHGQWAGATSAVRGHLLALNSFMHAIAGDAQAALEVAHERVRTLRPSYDERGLYVLYMVAARIAVICDDAHALRAVLDEMDAIEVSHPAVDFSLRKWPHAPVVAQCAWLEGRPEQAVARWQEALEHEEAIDVYGQAPETRVRLARALARRGEIEAAASVLNPVFARAYADDTPGGVLLAFEALRELAECDWRGALTAEQRKQLNDWVRLLAAERADRTARSSTAHPSTTGPAGPAEGLTARELDVLRRIAAGDSNKLIARALDLSLHTVKRHVANILGKLDLDTRGQAAAWYRERQA
jgi:LuxR family transcriptional regulator, maltose regulon positive regulatory protein